MGYYVDKLQQATTANLGAFDADSTDLQAAIDRLDDSKEALDALRSIDTMFGGDVDGAIRDAASRFVTYLEELRQGATTLRTEDDSARSAFEIAATAYESLPSGQPNFIESALGSLPQVEIPVINVVVTGEEYLNGVIARREQEREEQAREAMRTLNDSLRAHASTVSQIPINEIRDIIEEEEVDKEDDGSGQVPGGNGPGPYPGSGPMRNPLSGNNGHDPSSFGSPFDPTRTPAPYRSPDTSSGNTSTQPEVHGGIGPQPIPGGYTPVEYPPVEVPNTVIPPVSEWPLKVYRPGDLSVDGPLDGGYSTPRNPADGSMPRDPYLRQFIEERQHLGQAGFGVLGAAGLAGAALATRGGLGSGVGAGIGASSGVAGGVAPSAGGGIGGAAGSVAGPGAGTSGAAASGAASSTGAQGAGGRGGGAGSGMMGGGAGGGAASQEESKSKRRRKYGRSGVEFFDQADAADPGAAGAAGSASDAVIDVAHDFGERW